MTDKTAPRPHTAGHSPGRELGPPAGVQAPGLCASPLRLETRPFLWDACQEGLGPGRQTICNLGRHLGTLLFWKWPSLGIHAFAGPPLPARPPVPSTAPGHHLSPKGPTWTSPAVLGGSAMVSLYLLSLEVVWRLPQAQRQPLSLSTPPLGKSSWEVRPVGCRPVGAGSEAVQPAPTQTDLRVPAVPPGPVVRRPIGWAWEPRDPPARQP